MSRKPGYLNKLPPELAEDPFWATFHKPPPTSFGIASRRLSPKDLPDDHEYHLRKEIDQWEHVDGHLVRHGRLQVESRWGTVKSPAPGDYDPDADKRSKMPSFPSPIITRRDPDTYFEELTLARSQPLYTFRVATANAIKRQQSQKKLSTSHSHQRGNTASSSRGSTLHSAINGPESPGASHTLPHAMPSSSSGTRTRTVTPAVTKSEWRDVNVEDMKKALLPAPGQYETDVYHTLNFHHTPIPHLKPKQQLCKPRPKIDLETLELVKDENQLFDGSYFQYDDPTKRQYPSYTLGSRRPIVEREYERVGPGDYNDPTVTGAPSVLSTSATLKLKPGLSASSMRSGLSSHGFGRKTLLK
eukprot:gene8779-6315_t